MINALFTSKDPKKKAVTELEHLIEDLESFWPEDGDIAEREFVNHCKRVIQGDRTIFNFHRTVIAVNQMGTRMVKPIFDRKDPIIVGISQAATLSLGEIVNDIRPEVTHRQLIDETKRDVLLRVKDLKSEPSIYVTFYTLAKRARCARFLARSTDIRHLCQTLAKILSNHYGTEDVDKAFMSAESLVKSKLAEAENPAFKVTHSLRMAYASLPILQFLQNANPNLNQRWDDLKTNVRPLLARLRKQAKDDVDDTAQPTLMSGFFNSLVSHP